MARKPTAQKSERESDPVTLKNAQRALGSYADNAHFRDRIVPITKRGKEFAALIGPADLEKLRRLNGAA